MGAGAFIKDVETILLDIPLKRPHVMSFGRIPEVNFVLVRIVTDSGLTGCGEAATLQGPTWSEESAETIKVMIDKYIAPVLKGKNLLEFNILLREIDSRIRGNFFAKAAVEFALLDAFGQHFGRPLHELLGGRLRDGVDLSWSLASGGLESDLKEAKKMAAQGFRIFKIKVGAGPLAEDVEKIKILRQELGDGVRLRVDANQGWNLTTALRAMREMDKYGLEFMEQPLPKWDLDGLAELRRKSPTPLMADESLSDEHSCLDIIKRGAADIFSIKLTKSGGLLRARELYAIIRAAGLEAYIGCMLETSLGTATYLQFAALADALPYGCELFGPLLLEGDIVDEPVVFKDGQVMIPTREGLGVSPNQALVERYRRG